MKNGYDHQSVMSAKRCTNTMWQSFAAIGRETAEISRWIKKKQQQNIRACALRYGNGRPSATWELNRDWKQNTCKIYSADLVGMVQHEHDEYFQSKNGEALHCVAPALKEWGGTCLRTSMESSPMTSRRFRNVEVLRCGVIGIIIRGIGVSKQAFSS